MLLRLPWLRPLAISAPRLRLLSRPWLLLLLLLVLASSPWVLASSPSFRLLPLFFPVYSI
jgi:hypothetical protein